jgi:hypothetical protein
MQLTFQPLSLERQADYKRLLHQCPQIASDYSFVNIWAWRDIYGLEWAWNEDLVWLRQHHPSLEYWAPVGDWMSKDWVNVFKRLFKDNVSLTRVPEQLWKIWSEQLGAAADLVPNPDHWDYIYSVDELINLKGNKFHKKKNLLHQFTRKYDSRYIHLDEEMIEKALTLQTEWCLWRDCEESTTLEAENHAILNTFQDWSRLEGIFGGGLEVDGNMVAYSVAEPLGEQTLVIHFEKGCPGHKGVYQAINQMFLARSGSGFTYVNREQDLGDPGLRKAKESYNPVGYLEKFSGTVDPARLA